MSRVMLGGDNGAGTNQECLNTAEKVFKEAGHEVVNLGVGPNLEGRIKSKGVKDGDTLIFFVNGAGYGTPCSFYMAFANKASKIWFAYPDSAAKVNNLVTCESLKTTHLNGMAGESDVWNGVKGHLAKNGLDGAQTVDKFYHTKPYSDKMAYVCGDNCEGLAKKILDGTGEGDGSTEGTSTGGKETIMSGWESLCDLMKPLDGLAMMVQRGDTVIVRRIEVPGEPTGDASIVTTRKDETKDAQGQDIKNVPTILSNNHAITK